MLGSGGGFLDENDRSPDFTMSEMKLDPALRARDYIRSSLPGITPASQFEDGAFWTYTHDGRSALYILLRALGIGVGDRVAVPAWICWSVLDPIRAVGAEPVYYEVDEHGAPVDVMGVPQVRAAVVVHYFGFAQPLERLARLCRERGVILIEDCAHAWLTRDQGAPVGQLGDAAIYSLRKFLPIEDGGALRISQECAATLQLPSLTRPPFRQRLKVQKERLQRIEWPPGIHAFVANLLRAASKVATAKANGNGTAIETRGRSAAVLATTAMWELSPSLRRLVEQSNTAEIFRKRREHYARLDEIVRTLSWARPWHSLLPQEACPWAYPFITERPVDVLELRSRGVQVYTYGAPLNLTSERERYPTAVSLRERILLLPCHHQLTREEIELMGRSLRAFPGPPKENPHTARQDRDSNRP